MDVCGVKIASKEHAYTLYKKYPETLQVYRAYTGSPNIYLAWKDKNGNLFRKELTLTATFCTTKTRVIHGL